MSYIQRKLELEKLLEKRSVMLLGPRQTGKSSYIRKQLKMPIVAYFNLLDQATLLDFSTDLTRMRQEILVKLPAEGVVVVDEIQKLPELLDEVHLMIEEHGLRFLLTGSSARKLKRAGVNLLGGRARQRNLYPLSFVELGDEFELSRAMNHGLIPAHYTSDLVNEDLRSYIGQYLGEEVAAEALIRNIPAFARFLEVAALCNSQQVNYSEIASDAQVSRQTVVNYFEVLSDTLVGSMLEPYRGAKKRKSVSIPKFYFFDMGVVKSLRRLKNIEAESKDFGDFFEHFIFMELCAWRGYCDPFSEITYWRTKQGQEVDFIVDDSWAIEVKAVKKISGKHLKGLKAFSEENLQTCQFLVCQEATRRTVDGVIIYPWREFLTDLWEGKLPQAE